MSRTESRPSAGRSAGRFLRELLIVAVGALIVAALLRTFVGQLYVIPSGSMEHTLDIGDRVVTQKVTDFHRGDVVVFEDPGNWLSDTGDDARGPFGQLLELFGVLPESDTGYLIKRVVGMPGDRVVCCDEDGRVSVNAQPLDEVDYLFSDEEGPVAPSEVNFEVLVPAGRLFVLGDHRNFSQDSRCHLADESASGPVGDSAFVPVELVVGTAWAVVFPVDHLSRLPAPATYDAVPAPTSPAPAEAEISPEGVTC
ncbi:MAG: signal peptidase I [Propionibacteriaceae bacterium]